MSHQVMITFDIDENRVQENAEKEAGRQIAREVIEAAFGHSYNRDSVMARYVKDAIREMLAPEKERIISEAINDVVENLRRTKAVRERLQTAMEGEEHERIDKGHEDA